MRSGDGPQAGTKQIETINVREYIHNHKASARASDRRILRAILLWEVGGKDRITIVGPVQSSPRFDR